MKILMIGLGSIGQRHLRNLKKLYGNEHEILAYRVRRMQQTFSDDMKIRANVNLEEEYNIRVFSDLDEALQEKPEIVFITNITSNHMECAMKAAVAGCDIFLEKPISDTMDGIKEFSRFIRENGNIVYVGFQNRFHPCIKDAKRYIQRKKLGKLISVDNEFSERLTTMHTYENYSTTYIAQKKMGGGPVLNLQIHCLDYLQCLFGCPEKVFAISEHSSDLNIDVEDYASSLYLFRQSDGSKLPVYSHTDFFQYPPVHKMKIVGEKGYVELDMNKAITQIIIDGDCMTITHDDFTRNSMFLEELQEFMNCIHTRTSPDCDFGQGVISLKMALAAKKSAMLNSIVKIGENI